MRSDVSTICLPSPWSALYVWKISSWNVSPRVSMNWMSSMSRTSFSR